MKLSKQFFYFFPPSYIQSTMNKVDDEVIINDICDYAKKHKVKELLQEYLRRIIVDQPEDPVPFVTTKARQKA